MTAAPEWSHGFGSRVRTLRLGRFRLALLLPTPLFGSSAVGLQLSDGFSAGMSPRGMAEHDLEQTTPQTLVAARRTYSPSQSTYSSVSEFALHPKSGRMRYSIGFIG